MKFKLHPFKKFIYFVLKSLTRFSFKTFYKNKFILNKNNLQVGNPVILVSNHPSTLTDVLNVAKLFDTQVFFLANAGMFTNKIAGYFFQNTFCIPIERKADVQGRKINNDSSFAKCYDFLARGGTLYIAPEGGSSIVRRIRKIKSGTARIALNAESTNAFDLNLKILPVGVNYSSPMKFRSDVVIEVGEPILVKDFQGDFQEDEYQAAKKLTRHLEQKMQKLVLHTAEKDEDVDTVLKKIEEVHIADKKATFKEQYLFAKYLLPKLIELKEQNVTKFEELKKNINQYFNKLLEVKLTDEILASRDSIFKSYFILLFGAVIALFGYLGNFPFYHLPKWLIEKTKLYVGYTSTVYIMLGIVIFFILYPLYFLLFKMFLGAWTFAILGLLLLFFAGIFSSFYIRSCNKFKLQMRFRRIKKKNPELISDLIFKREEIKTQLKNLY